MLTDRKEQMVSILNNKTEKSENLKITVMNKRIYIPVFLVLALLSVVYAIYRSTDQRVTLNGIGRQVVSGEPQHGLILGLCIFAAFCVLGAVLLLLDKSGEITEVHHVEKPGTIKRTATNYPQ